MTRLTRAFVVALSHGAHTLGGFLLAAGLDAVASALGRAHPTGLAGVALVAGATAAVAAVSHGVRGK